MEMLQEQLNNYRKQKERKRRITAFKNICYKFIMLGTGRDTTTDKLDVTIDINKESKLNTDKSEIIESNSEENDEPNEDNTNILHSEHNSKYTKILRLVYFLFWVTLYVIAIELQFGMVFLLVTALFLIYFNTRTGPKSRNEISAYSVFNKNCESIDGTLKAEQFEREIRFGAASMK